MSTAFDMVDAGKLPILCIKIGGKALAESSVVGALAREMAEIESKMRCILIHGGGAEVSRVSTRFGFEPRFVDGVRMTTADEMDVVDMVLAGKVNKYLVRLLNTAGVRAVGLSGNDGKLIIGERISPGSHTGRVAVCDPAVLQVLTDAGMVPVVCSTAMDGSGVGLNINADEAALAVARAIQAECMVFISDIPGVLKSETVLPKLTPLEVDNEIREGTIRGGMIPKTRSSVSALESGVGSIVIGSYTESGDLSRLISGSSGTKIVEEETSI